MATGVNGRFTVDTKIDTQVITALADLAVIEDSIADLDIHLHNKMLVAPNLAVGILATSNVAAWALGAATATILTVAGGTIVDIHTIELYSIDTNGLYQIDISHSAEGLVISIPFEKASVGADNYVRLFIAGSHLCGPGTYTAQIACSAGTATCRVKLGYHIEAA